MTRRRGLFLGLRLLAVLPVAAFAAGCGTRTSKYNNEGFSREFEKPTTPVKGGEPASDPDDPRERRRKKAAAG